MPKVTQGKIEKRFSFERHNHVGYITLNRSKRLNVVDLVLLKAIYPLIKQCENAKDIKLLVIQNKGKAFCVGADIGEIIKNLFYRGQAGYDAYLEQMDLHYSILHYIGSMTTPIVSIMDGIVIGGGLCFSALMPFRIATENTIFSMPETKIGSFTDSIASFVLSRMRGNLGVYLGLTSATLQAEDVLFSGQATHFMKSCDVPALNASLSKLIHPTLEMINKVISRFSAKDDHVPQSYTLTSTVRDTIHKCFQYNTVEEIVQALQQDGSIFALKARKAILQRSPTSLKITLEVIRRGERLSLQGCLIMEYNLWHVVPYQHDFKEGVGAFFEKRAAQWQPSKLADVNLEQHIRKNLFGFQHEMRRLCLSSKDYVESPFERFGLPTTEQVRAIEEKYHMKSMSEVESWFLAEHQGKFGIRQRVQQALNQGQYQKSYKQAFLHYKAKL